jgi:hypothetical protein
MWLLYKIYSTSYWKSSCNVHSPCIVYTVFTVVFGGGGVSVIQRVHLDWCICRHACVCTPRHGARVLKVSIWGLMVCCFVTGKKLCMWPFLSSNLEVGYLTWIKLQPVAVFNFCSLHLYLQNFSYNSAVCYRTHVYIPNPLLLVKF